jgi:hypothetical protein
MVRPAQSLVASSIIFTPQGPEWTTFPLLYDNLDYYLTSVHRCFIPVGPEACEAVPT